MSRTVPQIDSCEFGKIIIDGKTYNSDLIITAEGVISNWWRKEGHSLHPQDLDKIIDVNPEILIIGRGASGILKVPEKTREWLKEKSIKGASNNKF